MFLDDILSMPDSWEYRFFAAWDTAFHCIPLAMIDPEFAKKQLDLLTRKWYMHPNGQLPAYEWNFGDVNPPGETSLALEPFTTVVGYQEMLRDLQALFSPSATFRASPETWFISSGFVC